ncbi:hypothetical protein [Qipengyuania oceanensis]|uniref:DUF2157 domain-containing protein n=1 Tax=Qipengyuania oceanensis TaxID=1463597 RepID=A0A844YGI9_9SPHN|nr:hypothetical protein [Qipengyuania oceanensis]MXO62168.1 hypothetical protein [Qipengyuania oceanensis]
MYSEEDINSAVAAGALSADAAAAFRAHMTQVRDMPRGDEENFRLVTSFNDIFVTIGVVIMLMAAGAIGEAILHSNNGPSPLAGALVAATAWGLAEFFTLRRRMALPSIILLLAWVGGIFATLLGIVIGLADNGNDTLAAILVSASALVAAGAAWVHWRRFMVPITVAAGAVAVGGSLIALIGGTIASGTDIKPETVFIPLVFAVGIAIFAFAMRWDASDRARTTRRSDVAFWLHLAAAPMIAHPLFHWLGVTDGGEIGVAAAAGVLTVYVALGLVALAIDRRALLVSALAYVLIALTWLFDRFGAVELNFALTALVIGSALLTLSAFWTPIRKLVVEQLPNGLQARLPEAILVG